MAALSSRSTSGVRGFARPRAEIEDPSDVGAGGRVRHGVLELVVDGDFCTDHLEIEVRREMELRHGVPATFERDRAINRSATATVVRCVFAFGRSGITDASHTRRPS